MCREGVRCRSRNVRPFFRFFNPWILRRKLWIKSNFKLPIFFSNIEVLRLVTLVTLVTSWLCQTSVLEIQQFSINFFDVCSSFLFEKKQRFCETFVRQKKRQVRRLSSFISVSPWLPGFLWGSGSRSCFDKNEHVPPRVQHVRVHVHQPDRWTNSQTVRVTGRRRTAPKIDLLFNVKWHSWCNGRKCKLFRQRQTWYSSLNETLMIRFTTPCNVMYPVSKTIPNHDHLKFPFLLVSVSPLSVEPRRHRHIGQVFLVLYENQNIGDRIPSWQRRILWKNKPVVSGALQHVPTGFPSVSHFSPSSFVPKIHVLRHGHDHPGCNGCDHRGVHAVHVHRCDSKHDHHDHHDSSDSDLPKQMNKCNVLKAWEHMRTFSNNYW